MSPDLLRALVDARPGDLLPEPELTGSAWSRHPDGELLFHPWASTGDLARDCSVWWPIELLSRSEWELYLDHLSVRLIVEGSPEAFDAAFEAAMETGSPPTKQSVAQHQARLLRALGKDVESPGSLRRMASARLAAPQHRASRAGEAEA